LATSNRPAYGMRPRAQTRAFWATLGVLAIVLPGCTRIDNALAKVPIFAFMHDAPSFDPYEHPLPAPPGSVPYLSPNGAVLPPQEATEAALNEFAASPLGQNPLAADDPAALGLGQVMYERHCSVCHGIQGGGDGPLVGPGKFPSVPALTSGIALDRADGYVYAVVRAGRGLMPAYGARMTHTERWAVVTYVNSLQAAAGAVTPAQPAPGAAAPQTQPGAAPQQTQPAQPDTTPAQQ
jgi:mono/diheme cytochrome c family protein